jgi:hypothetical protein
VDGRLEVWVENASIVNAWFDDLTVERADVPTALVVQEAHYDPWGLELAPLGMSLQNPSRELFNGGSERERGLSSLTDLHWDETPFRPYDAQLGRFHGVDLLADMFPGITPMHFGYNNPVLFNDPSGLIGDRGSMNGTRDAGPRRIISTISKGSGGDDNGPDKRVKDRGVVRQGGGDGRQSTGAAAPRQVGSPGGTTTTIADPNVGQGLLWKGASWMARMARWGSAPLKILEIILEPTSMGTDDVVPFIPVRGMIVPGQNGYDDFSIGNFPTWFPPGTDPKMIEKWKEVFDIAVNMYNNQGGKHGTEKTDVYELFVQQAGPVAHECKSCLQPPGAYAKGSNVPIGIGTTYKFGIAKHDPGGKSVEIRYANEPGMVGPGGKYGHQIRANALPRHKALALERLLLLQYAMNAWFRTTPSGLQNSLKIHTRWNLPVGNDRFN